MNGSSSEQLAQRRSHWWVFGLVVASCLLTFFTLWAVALQILCLAVVIFLLTRRAARAQRAVLLVAMLILVLTLISTPIVAGVTAYNLDGTFDGTTGELNE